MESIGLEEEDVPARTVHWQGLMTKSVAYNSASEDVPLGACFGVSADS